MSTDERVKALAYQGKEVTRLFREKCAAEVRRDLARREERAASNALEVAASALATAKAKLDELLGVVNL